MSNRIVINAIVLFTLLAVGYGGWFLIESKDYFAGSVVVGGDVCFFLLWLRELWIHRLDSSSGSDDEDDLGPFGEDL